MVSFAYASCFVPSGLPIAFFPIPGYIISQILPKRSLNDPFDKMNYTYRWWDKSSLDSQDNRLSCKSYIITRAILKYDEFVFMV